jgi:hypothetical protein
MGFFQGSTESVATLYVERKELEKLVRFRQNVDGRVFDADLSVRGVNISETSKANDARSKHGC